MSSSLKILNLAYKTNLGLSFQGKAEAVLSSPVMNWYKQQVDLIFTSPPFPLNRKKAYGNLQGDEYVRWLTSFGRFFRELLKPKGSIVIELGNSWEPGRPVMSTLALKALLSFLEVNGFVLCEQFIWYNTAKLPTPAQWVNVERIRVKDSFTHIWWMSLTDRPSANNRNVLVEYSDSMQHLLKTQKYNAGKRPSEHHIGQTSFLQDNDGAIPSNVLAMANTQASSNYQRYCRVLDIPLHPARMPIGLPDFFIRFLTQPGDLVLDPFAGSNTTGEAAEHLERRWIAIEPTPEYIAGSVGRFVSPESIAELEIAKRGLDMNSSDVFESEESLE